MFNKLRKIKNIILEDVSIKEIKHTSQENIKALKEFINPDDIKKTILYTGIEIEQLFKKFIKEIK